MAEQHTPTRQELEAQIIAKAWQNEAFKQELLSHPRATVIRELGLKDIPDNLDIKVLEENPTTLYMVLPMKPVSPTGTELSEEELEAVAGGTVALVVKTVLTGLAGCV